MKKVILGLLLLSSFAQAGHRANLLGPVYDSNNKLLQPGDRAVGLACLSYTTKSRPELFDNPAAVRTYIEKELLFGVEKIMVPYSLNEDYLVVLNAPFTVLDERSLENFVSIHRPSFASRAAEFSFGIIMAGINEPQSPYQVRQAQEACVAVEGTFDNRSGWQKLKDRFAK